MRRIIVSAAERSGQASVDSLAASNLMNRGPSYTYIRFDKEMAYDGLARRLSFEGPVRFHGTPVAESIRQDTGDYPV